MLGNSILGVGKVAGSNIEHALLDAGDNYINKPCSNEELTIMSETASMPSLQLWKMEAMPR